jgi:hypothetical protein
MYAAECVRDGGIVVRRASSSRCVRLVAGAPLAGLEFV